MQNSTNQISLYKKLDNNLAELVNIQIEKPQITYNLDDEYIKITLDDSYIDVINVNEYDVNWSPTEHNMNISQTFKFLKPNYLFGENSLALEGSKIGLGVHCYSKTASFQKTIDIGTIENQTQPLSLEFQHSFSQGELRGSIQFDFFLFLKELKHCNPLQASSVGMALTSDDLYSFILIVDGEGSIFPISEFNDKNGPLWRLECNWADAEYDSFDIANVNLELNVGHYLFNILKDGKTRIARSMMGDIMIQAMSIIISQTLIIEQKSLEDVEDRNDTILSAVKYWVETFEVDTSSISSVSNSIRKYWDKEMMEGEG